LRFAPKRWRRRPGGSKISGYAGNAIEIARAEQPDATIDTDPGTLFTVLWNGRSLADAQRAGDMKIEGDKAAVKRLVRLFPLPEPVGA
jgi:hypothetical protein